MVPSSAEAQANRSEGIRKYYANNPQAALQKSAEIINFYKTNPEARIIHGEIGRIHHANHPERSVNEHPEARGRVSNNMIVAWEKRRKNDAMLTPLQKIERKIAKAERKLELLRIKAAKEGAA